MSCSDRSDAEILNAIRSGDEEAFLSLYRRLQAPIYRFAFQMSGSQWVAEDVTQDVFVTLLHRSAAFDAAKGTLSAYLMGVARNCLLRRLQAERRFGAGNGNEDGGKPGAASHPDPLSEMVRGESAQLVRDAVVTLPLHYREVLVLCELGERSYEETSLILRCSAGTVRSRLHRAREMLARKLRTTDRRMAPSRTKCMRCPA